VTFLVPDCNQLFVDGISSIPVIWAGPNFRTVAACPFAEFRAPLVFSLRGSFYSISMLPTGVAGDLAFQPAGLSDLRGFRWHSSDRAVLPICDQDLFAIAGFTALCLR